MTALQRHSTLSLRLVALLLASACGDSSASIEAEISVIDQCLGRAEALVTPDDDAGVTSEVPSAIIDVQEGELHIEVVASFRCGQEVCARVTEEGATLRCTVEPCNLHPTEIPRCPSCAQRLAIIVPVAPGDHRVEVYHRQDARSSMPEAVLVASEQVTVESR
jgi:hypothetical protein